MMMMMVMIMAMMMINAYIVLGALSILFNSYNGSFVIYHLHILG